MSKEKRRVPKLRFPGFTEDWEQRKLDDIAKIKTGGGTPKTANPEYWSGNIPWIQSSDLVEGDIAHVNINKFINNNALKNSAAKLISRDSIALVTRVGVGKVAVINQDFTTSQDFLSLSDFDRSDIKFLAYQLYRLMQENAKVLQGTSIKGITKTELIEQSISIPSSGQEQHLISNVLSKIDSIITLHQRKLEHLNLKKKALLQKLFPKNGECYPELRFPGFIDAWEQRKLGEIFEYLQNNTLSRDSLNYKNPNIKNIHYGDILVKFDEILDGSNKDIPYINSELDLSKFSKSLLRDGDIVFSDTAEDDAVGKAIELQNVSAPFILSGLHTIPCRPLIPFGKGYLGNFLNSDSYRMQLRPLVQGIKVSSISKSALKDTMIVYPKKLDEQEKIGGLFYHISKMITLHQRKLEHLQLQKKALLQQMFV